MDEIFLGDKVGIYRLLVLAHRGYYLAHFLCFLASGEERDVTSERFHLINIYSETLLIFIRCIGGFAFSMELLVCELVAIEVLYGFCGIGEDLVVASVYVESHVRLAVFFHF